MAQPQIKNSVSNRLSTGINIFLNISNKNQTELNEFIQRKILSIVESHSKQLPPGFSFSRKLYRSFSIDPTKYRPSSEALWRRIKNGFDFPFVNPFVDLTNFLSLKYQVSYGLYDLDKIEGDIDIMQGVEGDFYQGIRKDIINLNGRILLRDRVGPFGNPSSDSLRTSTSGNTADVLQVIFFHKDDISKEKILSETYLKYTEFFKISDSQSYVI